MTAVRKLGPGDDIEMMQTPDQWTHSFLPLKRTPSILPLNHPARMSGDDLGILTMGGGPTVRLGNMFKLTDEIIRYDSFQAIYDAGWRVD